MQSIFHLSIRPVSVIGIVLLLLMPAYRSALASDSRLVLSDADEFKEFTAADYNVEALAENLDHPWSLAFLPDGKLLISERSGQLLRVDPSGKTTALTGVPAVFARSQGGLFDVVLHPDYAENGWLYLSYATGKRSANATRLARARLDGDALVDLEVLFTAVPFKDTPVHYGGRMTFLPDNTLLLSIGDGYDYREMAQSNDNHFGSIVRLHDDGRIPADNPFVDDEQSLDSIWSYGHRNPQAIVYDAVRDIVLAHEHGPAGGDELNLIERGGNYGWPIATYGVDYSGAAISPYTQYPGTTQPLLHWTPSIAPGGMALVTGDAFPSLRGNILVAALKAREVRRLAPGDDGAIVQQPLFKELGARIRDVRIGPDGNIYLLTDSQNGQLLQVTPTVR